MRLSAFLLAFAAALQDPAPKAPETILHRMGDLRWQHGSLITSIAVLPGDKQALSAGYNGIVVLWDLQTGIALRTFEGHKGFIWSLALYPDGKRFVTGGEDGRVLVWDTDAASPVKTFAGLSTSVRS